MNKRVIFLLWTLLIILSVLAVAAQTDIVITPVDNHITTTEEAAFSVVITNNDRQDRTYTLYGLDVIWNIDPQDKKFTLAAGESKTTTVKVKPLGPFKPSTYSVKLYLDSSLSPTEIPFERHSEELSIVLYPEEPLTYLPTIRATVDLNHQINPQEPLSVKLDLENRNRLDLSGLQLRVHSEMPEFVQDVPADLAPLQRKTMELTITPNRYQPPKEYTLFFVLEYQGETVKVIEKIIEIMPLTPEFSVAVDEQLASFRRITTLTIHNGGNTQNTQDIKLPLSALETLLAQGEMKIVREEGQRMAIWRVPLGPDETTTITFVTNYRLPLYILIFCVVVGLFYVLTKSPLKLLKKATTTKGSEEGTLSEVKVTLEVRNLSSRPVKDVKIVDVIPGIANIEKSLDVGTVHPQEIKHTAHGSKVIWSIPELEAREQRLITYKIKAKLNILGTFSLPRASAECARGKRKAKTYSNIFKLG